MAQSLIYVSASSLKTASEWLQPSSMYQQLASEWPHLSTTHQPPASQTACLHISNPNSLGKASPMASKWPHLSTHQKLNQPQNGLPLCLEMASYVYVSATQTASERLAPWPRNGLTYLRTSNSNSLRMACPSA